MPHEHMPTGPTVDIGTAHLRVARPSDDLAAVVKFYRDGLGLAVLGEFKDHDGFDGVMLGRKGAAYHLEVSDNGIGFDERYRDRIFQVFQRLHGRGTYEGTGIGLAMCKKIVERHGGTITAPPISLARRAVSPASSTRT